MIESAIPENEISCEPVAAPPELKQGDGLADTILREDRSLSWRLINNVRLMSPPDFLFSIDLSALWRHHLVWAKEDGKELLDIVTGRFASSNVFLSLMFIAEVGTYFSPSGIGTTVRTALYGGPAANNLEYSTGITLIISMIVTGTAILANFTAYGIIRSIDDVNAHLVLRSAMGLYAAQLPNRLTALSIYIFFAWLLMFWWINLSNPAALCMTIILVGFVVHVVSTFSALGRVIMATSAMGYEPILPKSEEVRLLPKQLSNILISEAAVSRQLGMTVNRQYAVRIRRDLNDDGEMSYESSLRRRHPGIKLRDESEQFLE